ncbi:MAG: hypothetical protein NC930_00080 [Candidatus Omnitrophica bacterium]|nr:hypothetical protein [Candidatus Omnitrophota bacterium]
MSGKSIIVAGILLLVTNAMTAAFFSSKQALQPAGSVESATPKEPVSPNLPYIIAQLNLNMLSWQDVRRVDQVAAVQEMIRLFKERENSAILNSAEFYTDRINEMITANPTVKNVTLPTLVKIVAVMEYDFYNGQNKEDLAQQILGPQLYEQNKIRLGRTTT